MMKASNRSRVFAVSDIHVDYPSNMDWVASLDPTCFCTDILIVAGDLTDDLHKLSKALSSLRQRFARVFFVPGNHELWIRKGDFPDSLQKFSAVLKLCDAINVDTKPAWIDSTQKGDGVWIIPLYSWYVKPEHGESSLFVEKVGEDPSLSMWTDNYFTKWPSERMPNGVATYFLELNTPFVKARPKELAITFSHFLPRRDLIFATNEEAKVNPCTVIDDVPEFNFSRVAGDARLDEQIRSIGARVHVYGHQHRNRRRMIDDILYVSNCLGYPSDNASNYRAAPEARLSRVW